MLTFDPYYVRNYRARRAALRFDGAEREAIYRMALDAWGPDDGATKEVRAQMGSVDPTLWVLDEEDARNLAWRFQDMGLKRLAFDLAYWGTTTEREQLEREAEALQRDAEGAVWKVLLRA